MSAPPSNRRLRNRIHTQITALHEGGRLGVPAAVSDYLTERVIQEVAEEYRAQERDAPNDGRAAIVTAGVPGAGKSSMLDTMAVGYRRIDPDEIKNILLARLETAGLLNIRHRHVLADGRPISPGELAGWVHSASTRAADRVRDQSLHFGENFVMEGTLSWHELPTTYVDALASHDYEQLTVLDIEVPLTIAIEQAKKRWWNGRQSKKTWHNIELGGRFISEAAIKGFYAGARSASNCAANARKLYRNANEAGIEAEVLIISRTLSGTEYRACLAPDGTVEPSQGAALGAVCIHCGSILRDPAAILKGVGRSRAHPNP
ncbi:zeta toxin family protein [Mycolicibacterium conceptionense]|uniref:zeta toxin family protein n=1 Tax=Mycolicibacterium conceptionense TaxID=451644 RepID=UPI003204E898